MYSRREFLTTITVTMGSAAASVRTSSAARGLTGTIGLQLWSLRDYLPKDLDGTLARVREMGFRDVEAAGLYGRTADAIRASLDRAGLRCPSAHMSFERLRDDRAGAFAEARTLGATAVVCPWIPNEKGFTREVALDAARAFNAIAKDARDNGLRFEYHCHGYEFVRSSEGTLFDTLADATEPGGLTFQMDIFHALLGGADPAALIDKYRARVTSLHVKDLKKEFPIKAGTSTAPPEADVPVGTGQVDMPAVLRAAARAKVEMYYIEDESATPLANIPKSLAYLREVQV
jgi:sugar phosphate isomerase/epimerase